MTAPVPAGVLVVSDTRSDGSREDGTSATIVAALEAEGLCRVLRTVTVPDERPAIEGALVGLCDTDGCRLVITTGGTGLAPRDVTPEATRAVAPVDVPGLAELLRAEGARSTPTAWLSRGVAGLRGEALIVNLAGSPGAVRDGMRILGPLLPHALQVRAGHAHHGERPR